MDLWRPPKRGENEGGKLGVVFLLFAAFSRVTVRIGARIKVLGLGWSVSRAIEVYIGLRLGLGLAVVRVGGGDVVGWWLKCYFLCLCSLF